MSHSELKNLNVKRTTCINDLKELKEQMAPLSQAINGCLDAIKDIDEKIQAIKARESVVVTEHAILRYLERVQGMDLEDIKKRILPSDVMIKIVALGSGSYPVGDGDFKIRVKNNAVITVLTKDK